MESFLAKADEKEREYAWSDAVAFYNQAFAMTSEQEHFKRGAIRERIGYALFMAARQSENVEEFKEKTRRAGMSYEEAKELYEALGASNAVPQTFRCDAMIAYLRYWVATKASEKKTLVEEAWRLAKEALESFSETGEALAYGKTYNQLSVCANFVYAYDSSREARERIVRGAAQFGEQAIEFLSDLGDTRELAKALAFTAIYLGFVAFHFGRVDNRESLARRAREYWRKGRNLSEESVLIELAGAWAEEDFLEILGFGAGTDEALELFNLALEYAEKTQDRYHTGGALDYLTYHAGWKIWVAADREEQRIAHEQMMKYAERARQQFSTLALASPRGGAFDLVTLLSTSCMVQADYETDPTKKLELREKAVLASKDEIELAEESGYPDSLGLAIGERSDALKARAEIETDVERRMKLLEEASMYAERFLQFTETFRPPWDQGMARHALARVKSELANSTKGAFAKEKYLHETILEMEGGFELCLQEASYLEKSGSLVLLALLGRRQYWYGDQLRRLFELNGKNEYLMKSIRAYEQASLLFQKNNLPSRMAECHWRTAEVFDTLGEYMKSGESFSLAATQYRAATEKLPKLKAFYDEYVVYMQAWSEIEKARGYHQREEYGSSKEHYGKAATLHSSTKHWGFLTQNYSAWTQLEGAEELSRREESEAAIQAFQEAARLFNEGKQILQEELDKLESSDERQMATAILKASDPRREYCIARVRIEEAKLLDKKGDRYESSEKYAQAAETLERISSLLQSQTERREIELIMTLSTAWQVMAKAEGHASPGLYLEASRLFDQARDLCSGERTRKLILGHSHFCRALEAGTQFIDTSDALHYSSALHHLETAMNYYSNAGLETAANYAKATELLFDSYSHMTKAKMEEDQEKKVRLYLMTEKLLQTSASHYVKAQQPDKRERVTRLLEKVRQDRELALSLAELLHVPSILSSTAAFQTPTSTSEKAVGLDDFEHAHVIANMIAAKKGVKVGEDLELELELSNAGKNPAQLIKIVNLAPDGFDLEAKSEKYRVEANDLNLKGRRLEPLGTEEVKLILRPRIRGDFILSPRITYLDELGTTKYYGAEPLSITVRELGVSGWIKGH